MQLDMYVVALEPTLHAMEFLFFSEPFVIRDLKQETKTIKLEARQLV
jgi:hypothetical protein